jgi:hypothetical protein
MVDERTYEVGWILAPLSVTAVQWCMVRFLENTKCLEKYFYVQCKNNIAAEGNQKEVT